MNTPQGELSLYHSTTEPLFVKVHRVGKKRKYIDEAGNVFVKIAGTSYKFPESISY